MNKTARAIFLHPARLDDLILSLLFDKHIHPQPDQTYIFYGPFDPDYNLFEELQKFNIDTTKIIALPDRTIWNNNIPVDIYEFGGWISQQFVKLLCCEKLLQDFDALLLQDCDTFCSKPYHWIDNGIATMYFRPNERHSDEYYKYCKLIADIEVDHRMCFVCELMPVLKSNWQSLVGSIENLHRKKWIEAIHDLFLQSTKKQIWFSEYELLGNWALQQKNTKLIEQKRFELKNQWQDNINDIHTSNCVANMKTVPTAGIAEFAKLVDGASE